MTILTRQRVILVKTETSYKVASSDVAVTDAIVCREPEITPLEGDTVERNIAQPEPGRSKGAPNFLANTRAMVTIPVELTASGTAGTPPQWGPLMKACWMQEDIVNTGLNKSVTYKPADGDQASLQIGVNMGGLNGIIQIIKGCRGTFTITFDQNAVPLINFIFTGDFVAPVSDPYNSQNDTGRNYSGLTLNPGVARVYGDGNTTVKWGASGSPSEICAGAIELDMANQMLYRSLPGCEESLITNRLPTGSFEAEVTATNTQGLFDKSEAADLQELVITQTNANPSAGNIIEIKAPACQVMAPSWTDRDGVTFVTMPLELSPKTGNDELQIKLT